jgi:hypothetical protein
VVVDLPPEVRRKLIENRKNSLLAQGLTDGAATTPADPASLLGSQSAISRRLLEKLKPDTSTHLDARVEDLEGFTTSELSGLYLSWG